MSKINHNPDVLSCIANLSNDEVFTPPDVAGRMLDMLPQELWSNPDATFLDPACKSGVFLREIAKRLIAGLAGAIPDLQQRIDHIFTRQLFGMAITELTSLLSRRSVYCSKKADGAFSVAHFDTPHGNILFDRTEHTWHNGRCIFCGASKDVYDRDNRLETHAYRFIHTEKPQDLFKMKFDVIIGNPPYQLSDGSGGSTDAAMPIYNKFIEQAKKLVPKYLIMIIPSKWMVGGRGLQSFRKDMMNDTHIKQIYDYEDASFCFKGIHIDGGVCYFLWDKDYSGMTNYIFTDKSGNVIKTKQYLKNKYFDYVIRDVRILPILQKTSEGKRFSEIVSSTKPYGIRKYLFNEPKRYPSSNLKFIPFPESVKVYEVKGLKGGAKRITGYVSPQIISNNIDTVQKYKIFFTTSYSTGAVNPPDPILSEPNSVCTETFLMIGPFQNQQEQQNCYSYMDTKFFKILLYYGKGTMQVTKSVFNLVPLQDFSEPWTDEKLYKKYGLTKEEIAFIDSMIRPME